MGLLLYVDRILRREIIFDSSALTCTVFVAHVLNVCRSSIAHVDSSSSVYDGGRGRGMLLLQQHDPHETQMRQGELMSMMSMPSFGSSDGNSSSTALLPALLVDSVSNAAAAARLSDQQIHMLHRIPWWQENVAYMLYVAASILLLLDIDIVGMVLPSSHCATSTCVLQHSPSSYSQRGDYRASSFSSRDNASCGRGGGGTGNSNVIRVSTVVTHCIIVGMILQLGVDQATFMTPAKIMARSFVFMGLSICWTYAVGISDHCAFNRDSSDEDDPAAAAACDHLGCHGPHEVSTEYDSIVLTNSSSNIRRKPIIGCVREGNSERAMHHHSSSSYRDGSYSSSSNSGKNTRAAATFVQGFTPCQLRFTVLLFSDSWHMPLAALAMGFIMIDRLQKLACTGSSMPSNHPNVCSNSSTTSSSCRPVSKKAAKVAVMPSARVEHEQLQAPDTRPPRVEFSRSSSSSRSPFNSKDWEEAEQRAHHHVQDEEVDFGKLASAQETTDEVDILSLFRQAQRHAGMTTASVSENEGGQQQLYAPAFHMNSAGIRNSSNERLGEMI